jgi:hypothetical protein
MTHPLKRGEQELVFPFLDSETGTPPLNASWHDLARQVRALRKENRRLRAALRALGGTPEEIAGYVEDFEGGE